MSISVRAPEPDATKPLQRRLFTAQNWSEFLAVGLDALAVIEDRRAADDAVFDACAALGRLAERVSVHRTLNPKQPRHLRRKKQTEPEPVNPIP